MYYVQLQCMTVFVYDCITTIYKTIFCMGVLVYGMGVLANNVSPVKTLSKLDALQT